MATAAPSCCSAYTTVTTYNNKVSSRPNNNVMGMSMINSHVKNIRAGGDPEGKPVLKAEKISSKVFHECNADGLYTSKQSFRGTMTTAAATIVSEPETAVSDPALEKIKTGFLKFKDYYKGKLLNMVEEKLDMEEVKVDMEEVEVDMEEVEVEVEMEMEMEMEMV